MNIETHMEDYQFHLGARVKDVAGAVGTVASRDTHDSKRIYVVRFDPAEYPSPRYDEFHGGTHLLPRTEQRLRLVDPIFVDPAMA